MRAQRKINNKRENETHIIQMFIKLTFKCEHAMLDVSTLGNRAAIQFGLWFIVDIAVKLQRYSCLIFLEPDAVLRAAVYILFVVPE